MKISLSLENKEANIRLADLLLPLFIDPISNPWVYSSRLILYVILVISYFICFKREMKNT